MPDPGIPEQQGFRSGYGGAYNGAWRGRRADQMNGRDIEGTSGAERDMARYQSMGAQAAAREAPQAAFERANYGMSDQSRNEQDAAMMLQRDAALGVAPSRAEMLQGRLTDDAINAQAAMAASTRGGPGAMALAARGASANAAQMQQSGARDMAALRADEMARARGEYMQATNTMRGMDEQRAQYDAGAANQMNQFNTGAQLQNRGMNDAQQMGYEKLGFGVGQADQAGRSEEAWRNLDREQNAQQWNDKKEETREGRWWDLGRSVVGGVFGGAGALLGSDMNMKSGMLPLGDSMAEPDPFSGANIGAAMMPRNPAMGAMAGAGIEKLFSDKKAKEQERQLGQAEGMLASMRQGLAAPVATQAALDRSRAMEAPAQMAQPDGLIRENPYAVEAPDRQAQMGVMLGGIGQGIAGGGENYAAKAYSRAEREKDARYNSAVGNRLRYLDENPETYGMLSDGRQKQDASEAEPAKMLDALVPYAYRYKPESGEDPTKQRYGIMAQDLEKTPMGASVVETTPRGKEINVPQAMGVSLASQANLNQRVRALEMGGARRGKR